MPKYVDADVLKALFLYEGGDVCDATDEFDTKWGASQELIEKVIDSAPAADVEPVIYGQWIPGEEISCDHICDQTTSNDSRFESQKYLSNLIKALEICKSLLPCENCPRYCYAQRGSFQNCRDSLFQDVHDFLERYSEFGLPIDIEYSLKTYSSLLCEITNNRLSKTNYTLDAIMSVVNEVREYEKQDDTDCSFQSKKYNRKRKTSLKIKKINLK